MFDFTSTQDYIEIGSNRVDIQNVKLVETCYDALTGQVIGTAMAKMLTFDMPDTTVTVEGQTFVYHAVTVDAEGNGDDTVVGTFIAYTAPVKTTEGITRVVAYDLMLKGNVEYSSTLDYSSTITMIDVLGDACTQAGITLDAATSLVNGAFVVSENPFLIGQTCCEVFSAVAEANGVIALILDDALAFKTLDITADAVAEAIAPQYSTLTIQTQYPAITKVTMRDTLTGATTSAGVDGGELVFKDNPFGTTALKRAALLANILTVVSGFTYYVYTAKGLGDPRLECGDRIRVIDAEQNEYDTFMFSMSYISTGADISQYSTIGAGAMAQAAVTNLVPRTTATERMAKKSYNTAVNAQTSANGKNTVYYQDAEPTGGAYANGDVWFDTNDGNRIYIYDSSAWVAKQFGTNAFAAESITAASGIIASLDAAKITVGEMSASRIKGDSLVLGGNANENGYVLIKNAAGNNAAFLDNTGYGLYDSGGVTVTTIASTTENATITVGSGKAYATIQAAADSIPYFINHTITLSIDAGDYNEAVLIQNHAGYGTIQLIGNGGDFSCNTLTIKRMTCRVFTQYCLADTYYVTDSQYAGFSNADSTAATDDGFVVQYSRVSMDECVVSNKANAAITGIGSNLYISNPSGSGNLYGYINYGGSIEVDGNALTATTLFSGLVVVDGRVMLSMDEIVQQGAWAKAEAWTYVSATSFTVVGAQTSKYGPGNPLTWRQNGTTRYSNVVSSSYSSGTGLTTVTKHPGYITSSGDCDMLNTTTYPITNAYISTEKSPQGFPGWFLWSTTLAGYSSNPTNAVYMFTVDGKWSECHIREATNGTSNTTGITLTLPITAATVTNMIWKGTATVLDNGTVQTAAALLYISSAGTTMVVAKNHDTSSTFTASGGKRVAFGNIRYPFA